MGVMASAECKAITGVWDRGSGDLAAKLPEAEKFLEFGWSTEV